MLKLSRLIDFAEPANKMLFFKTIEKLCKKKLEFGIRRMWHLITSLRVVIGALEMILKEAKKYVAQILGSP